MDVNGVSLLCVEGYRMVSASSAFVLRSGSSLVFFARSKQFRKFERAISEFGKRLEVPRPFDTFTGEGFVRSWN